MGGAPIGDGKLVQPPRVEEKGDRDKVGKNEAVE